MDELLIIIWPRADVLHILSNPRHDDAFRQCNAKVMDANVDLANQEGE